MACLTYSNAAKYYPESSETINSHIVQSRINMCSTKPPPITPPTMPVVAEEPLEVTLPCVQPKKVHV